MKKEDLKKKALELHRDNKGKISIVSKISLETSDDLSLAYTPGVAEPCLEIAKDKNKVYEYTSKSNLVAVVTNGSAVLGLGNIGPDASLPVMEGKSILFKEFGKVDAFPIAISSNDPDEIVEIVKKISPVFGGINLEDIKAPECFEIEEKLREQMDIPVFHDDQHGTAVVVLAAVFNAVKLTKRNLKEIKVIINGAGAAGVAVAKLLMKCGVNDIVVLDSKGALHYCRKDIQHQLSKKKLAKITNIPCRGKEGLEKDLSECAACHKEGLKEAIMGRDLFIGVSVANVLTKEMIKSMNKDPIIFAMANPVPEIMYDDAKEAGACIVGTGRSDMPNQINNVLAFPPIFRGTLDARASTINDEMKIAAAQAIADSVSDSELDFEHLMPDPLKRSIYPIIAEKVYEAALSSGVSRKTN